MTTPTPPASPSGAAARPDRPALVERAAARVGAAGGQRLMIVLRAPGCTWPAQPGGGCTNCGFFEATTAGVPVSAADYEAQLAAALAGRDLAAERVHEVDLYCSGSLLNDAEVPAAARHALLRRLAAEPALRHVLVEARPEYVTPAAVRGCRAALRFDQTLEVGVGLESADDHVREVLVNKGFGRPEFERAAAALAAEGGALLAYVLVKPLGLSEEAARADSVATGRYVFALGRRLGLPVRVALQPVFVVPGTPLAAAFARGDYRPPGLWTVVDVVRALDAEARAAPAAAPAALLVGLSDEGLGPLAVPDSCPRCRGALRAALARYNETGDARAFDGLACGCRPR
jgi:hypothetical protein